MEVVEAAMASAASIAYLTVAFFVGGAVLGVMVIVAAAVRREDRRYSLAGLSPGEMARGARHLTRLGQQELNYALRPRLISS